MNAIQFFDWGYKKNSIDKIEFNIEVIINNTNNFRDIKVSHFAFYDHKVGLKNYFTEIREVSRTSNRIVCRAELLGKNNINAKGYQCRLDNGNLSFKTYNNDNVKAFLNNNRVELSQIYLTHWPGTRENGVITMYGKNDTDSSHIKFKIADFNEVTYKIILG